MEAALTKSSPTHPNTLWIGVDQMRADTLIHDFVNTLLTVCQMVWQWQALSGQPDVLPAYEVAHEAQS